MASIYLRPFFLIVVLLQLAESAIDDDDDKDGLRALRRQFRLIELETSRAIRDLRQAEAEMERISTSPKPRLFATFFVIAAFIFVVAEIVLSLCLPRFQQQRR